MTPNKINYSLILGITPEDFCWQPDNKTLLFASKYKFLPDHLANSFGGKVKGGINFWEWVIRGEKAVKFYEDYLQ